MEKTRHGDECPAAWLPFTAPKFPIRRYTCGTICRKAAVLVTDCESSRGAARPNEEAVRARARLQIFSRRAGMI